jgi:hypothetical protein
MSALRYLSILIGILLIGGCRPHGLLVKRESELSCPTDIRQMVPWCAGEDAIFHCPCGPSREFYGHKPTCWGAWPASGSEWRNAYCGDMQQAIVYPDPVSNEPNSFDVDELSLPNSLNNPSTAEAIEEGSLTETPFENNSLEPDSPNAEKEEDFPEPEIPMPLPSPTDHDERTSDSTMFQSRLEAMVGNGNRSP